MAFGSWINMLVTAGFDVRWVGEPALPNDGGKAYPYSLILQCQKR